MATSHAQPENRDTALEEEPLASVAREQTAERRLAALGRMFWNNKKALIGAVILLFFGLVALFGPIMAPYSATAIGTAMPGGPSGAHWLGTTQLGQDIFSQLLAGTRGSLEMALAAALLTTLLAVAVGLTAGYVGGVIDDVLSLLSNVFLIFPALPLLIVVASYANAYNLRGPFTMAVVIALVGWPWGARALRSQMLTMRNKDFVLAARVIGEPRSRIIFSEILPNMLSIVVANFIFATLGAIGAEVGLDFIGLGDVTQATWGTMLYWAQQNSALMTGRWYWFVPPGLCIGLFSVGLVLMNYAMDELTNPRLRVERARSGSGTVPMATTSLSLPGGREDASAAS
jgi:peptide/nickel transport system permease protein